MEENLMYILYDETKERCFIDLGAMQFLNVPFPIEQPSAFRFMLDEEYLTGELNKINEYFNREGRPKYIFFDFARIQRCSARTFKLMVDYFQDIQLSFCNIETNREELVEIYYSDVYGIESKQYNEAIKVLPNYQNNKKLKITYFSSISKIEEQDETHGKILAKLREKKWCDLLKECSISEAEDVFRRDSRRANQYFDLSLLDFKVYQFKSIIYYLILRLIDWIRVHPDIKCGIIEQNDFTGKKKEAFLISSSVTGAIIANAIGCYLNVPTIFVISLGPEERDEYICERLQKGINVTQLKNDMIYIFDVIRFGQEYGDLKAILDVSTKGKVIAALGVANYENNIGRVRLSENLEIISLVNIKENEDILGYTIEEESK